MKRLLAVSAALVSTLVVLEIVLQLGHLAVVLAYREPLEIGASPGGTRVLCIGDSHTFGIGASSSEKSYPAQLEEMLRQKVDPEAEVINAGWPGQNSYEVLSKLETQLMEADPDYVFILAGANDRWHPPRRWSTNAERETSAGRGWRLEWRTARLARLLAHRFRGEESPDETFLPKIRERDTRVKVKDPEGGSGDGWQLLVDQDYQAALRVAEEGLGQVSDKRHELYRIKMRALVNLGRRAEASDLARQLEILYREEPSDSAAEAFLDALDLVGQRLESLELARNLTQRYPELALPWQIIGWRAYRDGDSATAIAAFEKCLGLQSKKNSRWWAGAMRQLAGALEGRDPERSVGLLVDAMLLDGEAAVSAGLLSLNLPEADIGSLVSEYLASLEQKGHVSELGEDLLSLLDEDPWRVSEENLTWLVAKARSSGAVPVVLSYPSCHSKTRRIQERVAVSSGASWVDLCAAFEAKVESGVPWEELFISDGHCTDAGYATFAELVAEAMLGLLNH